MANELIYCDTTGMTVCATLTLAAGAGAADIGKVWNGTALEARANANIATYGVALTETPAASGYYLVTAPGDLPAGLYSVEFWDQVGASHALTDTRLAGGELLWDGSAELIQAPVAAVAAIQNLSSAQAQTAAASALTSYDPPTKGELDTAQTAIQGSITGLNNLSSAQAQAAAAAAIAAYDPPTKDELDAGLAAVPAAVAAVDVDSTGTEPVTMAKALELILQQNLGAAAYDPDTGAWVIKGRDDSTTILTLTITDEGDRSTSVIA